MGSSTLISAVALARDYSSMWNQTAPMLEGFVRILNQGAEQFGSAVDSEVAAKRRPVVSETAYLLVGEVTQRPLEIDGLSDDEINRAAARVRERWLLTTGWGGAISLPLSADELADSRRLARSLAEFVAQRVEGAEFVFEPHLAGCGFVDESRADFIVGPTLYEMKAVERPFRSIDVRQLLTYATLNYQSGQHALESVGLVNPRKGTSVAYEVNALCRSIAGVTADELLNNIADFMMAQGVSG